MVDHQDAAVDRLGTTGPAIVGIVIAALTLIPTLAIALLQRRRTGAAA